MTISGHGDSPPELTGAGGVPHWRVAQWAEIPGLVHGFLGRRGGVSRGAWASLNLSFRVGDDARSVKHNWARVRSQFSEVAVVHMRQVHGTTVVRVPNAERDVGAADGMMTDRSGVALAVLTADCVPMAMIAPAARVAMILHTGWRGTVGAIAQAGLIAARDAFGVRPADWQVALGPAIAACCYEVEAGIGEHLERRWGRMPAAWQRAGSRGLLDLRQANRAILIANGVPPEQIVDVGPCTACASDHFFSHRRCGGQTGRQLSIVGWI